MMKSIRSDSVVTVIVTFNRKDLLIATLNALCNQTLKPDAIVIVDNHSADGTGDMLFDQGFLDVKPELSENNPLQGKLDCGIRIHYRYLAQNTGGAGGFHVGIKIAYELEHDWIWIMDDDVKPDPDCLEILLAHKSQGNALVPLRISKDLNLKEFPAIRFNLKNPFLIDIRDISFYKKFQSLSEMPDTIVVEDFSFEGPLLHREIVRQIGFPRADIFISGDDTDYALKIRYQLKQQILLVRDARIHRMFTPDPKKRTPYWKEYYLNRNFYFTHYRYGENLLVRLKPVALYAGLLLKNMVHFNFDLKKFRVNFHALIDAYKNEMPSRYLP